MFYQDHARTIVDPEYRQELDKEAMDKIKKVYIIQKLLYFNNLLNFTKFKNIEFY